MTFTHSSRLRRACAALLCSCSLLAVATGPAAAPAGELAAKAGAIVDQHEPVLAFALGRKNR